MVKYKIDVLGELKKNGWNQTRLYNERVISQGAVQKLRDGDTNITLKTLNAICLMLRCQPSDVIGVEPSDEEKVKYF